MVYETCSLAAGKSGLLFVMHVNDNANHHIRSRSKPTWRGTPPGTSIQFIEENLTNPQQFQGFMSSLSDIGGVIYGGAGPRKSSDDAHQDVMQQWRTTIHEVRTLTDVVKLKKPAFFLAISCLLKEYAPVNSVSIPRCWLHPRSTNASLFVCSISPALFLSHGRWEYLQV